MQHDIDPEPDSSIPEPSESEWQRQLSSSSVICSVPLLSDHVVANELETDSGVDSTSLLVAIAVLIAAAEVVAGVLVNPLSVQFSVTVDEASVARLDDGQVEESYKSTFDSPVTVSS